MKEKKHQLKITIYGYDVATVEETTKLIIEKISQLKLNFSGPIPFPIQKKVATVIISPFKHKRSQEHLCQIIHRRVIQILEVTPNDLDNLESLSNIIAHTAHLSFKTSF